LKTGDRILCVDVSGCPELQKDREYIAGNWLFCPECGTDSIEVGLQSGYKSTFGQCPCGTSFDTGTTLQYYKPERFVVQKEKVRYNSVKSNVKINEPVLS